MISTDLKPCPFCGIAVTVRASGANPRAKCSTDGCFGQKLPVVNLDVAEDVAAWNRRAQGLSQEDRDACLAGATALIGSGQSRPDYFEDPIAARNERHAAILRRLGGQTT